MLFFRSNDRRRASVGVLPMKSRTVGWYCRRCELSPSPVSLWSSWVSNVTLYPFSPRWSSVCSTDASTLLAGRTALRSSFHCVLAPLWGDQPSYRISIV